MRRCLLALAAAAAAAHSLADVTSPPLATITGRLAARAGARIAGLRVALNGGERVTTSRADGGFTLPAVEPGVYLLEIEAAPVPRGAASEALAPAAAAPALLGFAFPTYKVQVGGDGAVAVLEYRYPGAPKLPARHPIEAFAAAAVPFFEERPRPSVWGLLTNPTVMMILFMGGMVVAMPLLMVRDGRRGWGGRCCDDRRRRT